MPPRKSATADKSKTITRIQVLASPRQRDIIAKAAEKAGSNSSTFVLALTFKGIAQCQAGDEIPMVITGAVADKIRAMAEGQGISPGQMVEQLALGGAGAT